jgi:hypothetical protein
MASTSQTMTPPGRAARHDKSPSQAFSEPVGARDCREPYRPKRSGPRRQLRNPATLLQRSGNWISGTSPRRAVFAQVVARDRCGDGCSLVAPAPPARRTAWPIARTAWPIARRRGLLLRCGRHAPFSKRAAHALASPIASSGINGRSRSVELNRLNQTEVSEISSFTFSVNASRVKGLRMISMPGSSASPWSGFDP